MRKNRLVIFGLLAVAGLSITLAGCGRKGLISINGEKISKDEFYARLEQVAVPDGRGGSTPAGQLVIGKMIDDQIWEQFAKEKGVAPTDVQLQKRIDQIKKQAAGNMKQLLAQNGVASVKDLKENMKPRQAQINVLTKGITIPDSDVRKAYDQLLNQAKSPFKRPEQVIVSLIFTKDKKKADKAYTTLKSGGGFGTTAVQYSDDTSVKQTQGRVPVPIFRNMPSVPPTVVKIAFAQGVGKFSAPTLVQGQWVIVQTEQKRPAKTTTFDEVKDTIKESLAIQEGTKQGKFRDDLRKFIKDVNIVVNAERYKDIPKKIKKQAEEAEALDKGK